MTSTSIYQLWQRSRPMAIAIGVAAFAIGVAEGLLIAAAIR